jgi:hypothetical protein
MYAQLQSLEDSELNPAFTKKAKELRDDVFQNVKPMKMNGSEEFNGRSFSSYVEHLVKQINGGGLPVIKDTYIYLSESESR